MDDFTLATLQDSRNEWCSQLINILTPLIIEGCNSIFQESWSLCEENDETEKYLMTFQNFISRVPKWNSNVISKEKERIIQRSSCNYIEDLLTCVHIIQLKSLTCIRAGKNQKKININIPKLDDFIHKVYILVARKLYTNIYLYDKNVSPLQKQKHNREFEVIVQECILNSIRDNMPVEEILRTYLDETQEEDVEETIIDQKIPVEENEPEEKEDVEEKKEEVANKPEEKEKISVSFNENKNEKKNENENTDSTIQKIEEITRIRDEDVNNFDSVDEKIKIKETLDPVFLEIDSLDDDENKNDDTPQLDFEILG